MTNNIEYPANWNEIADTVKYRDGHKCRRCGKLGYQAGGSVELHAHHIQTLARGGSNKIQNLITLCLSCHEHWHGHIFKYKHSRIRIGPVIKGLRNYSRQF